MRLAPMRDQTAADSYLATELETVRRRTHALVAHLGTVDVERVLDPLLSPLVWDLGHIAAYEDLWLVHHQSGAELLRGDLAEFYDAFETPRAVRGDVEILDHAQALEYLAAVRERTLAVIDGQGTGDAFAYEMVLRHELQHTETMRQAMRIGGLLPADEPGLPTIGGDGRDWVTVDGGPTTLGAANDGFSLDNERPRHVVELAPFRIARRPVTNATWMHFVEGGGYERREWWSAEGWAWKEEYDITHDDGVVAGAPEAPVCHVSWFEADAFARAHGARLPTEAEWEKASTSAQLDATGLVWEWTASAFVGYPGFVAHPYPEYSEVFFDKGHRVLRGGSWATAPRVATPTFRNWDLPQRRQIFSGVRLATDLED